jgi:beta-lactamase superfamily II metal-dependent hydrolase
VTENHFNMASMAAGHASTDAIQVDMFEVQLGAAVLLQFRNDKGVVCILADAGVHAGGYKADHVHKKLDAAFASFNNQGRRVDLIIGTHYDADHLEGLVPILEDSTIAVGQVWLPPVANDVDRQAVDAAIADHHLLVSQFVSEAGEEILDRYLDAKEDEIGELRAISEPERDRARRVDRDEVEPDEARQESERRLLGRERVQRITYLRRHLETLLHELGDEEPHGNPPVEDEFGVASRERMWRSYRHPDDAYYYRFRHLEELDGEHRIAMAHELLDRAPALAVAQRRTLAHIRKAAVKDAINAASLYKVVVAAKRRNTPITPQSEIIDDGVPRRFVWHGASGRFIGARALASDGPVLTLLGPSKSLVKKHRDRLPRGAYLADALAFHMEVKTITPSNQLSYVARIEHGGQGVLVAGDAGFVDFKRGRNQYHQALLRALLPLHVIQIAHHGGANTHFYLVLTAAHFPGQIEHAYLLLSHATKDVYRPSREFRLFVEEVRRAGQDVSILFTSEPRREKVAGFADLIAPATALGKDRGDVQMLFTHGVWTVKQHLVAI